MYALVSFIQVHVYRRSDDLGSWDPFVSVGIDDCKSLAVSLGWNSLVSLHVQHTFFVHFFAAVLHDYNLKLLETS